MYPLVAVFFYSAVTSITVYILQGRPVMLLVRIEYRLKPDIITTCFPVSEMTYTYARQSTKFTERTI